MVRLRDGTHCDICSNRLYRPANEDHPDFKEILCIKCLLFPKLSFFNSVQITIEDEHFYLNVFERFNQEFEWLIEDVNNLFSQTQRTKINYMYLTNECANLMSFDDFLYNIKYLGYGSTTRKYVRLNDFVGNSSGLYLFEYRSSNNISVSKWIEKGGIYLLKSLGDAEENENRVQGVGRLNELGDELKIKYIGILTLFKAYLDFYESDDESDKKMFFPKDHQLMKN